MPVLNMNAMRPTYTIRNSHVQTIDELTANLKPFGLSKDGSLSDSLLAPTVWSAADEDVSLYPTTQFTHYLVGLNNGLDMGVDMGTTINCEPSRCFA